MYIPRSLADIQTMISSGIQESVHLDYKASLSLDGSEKSKRDVAKDVSSFANSDGGVIIYGVTEDALHYPQSMDGGVDIARYSKETLEQVIAGNIAPRIDGLVIHSFPAAVTHALYVVVIPKSHRAPHQSKDKKYYKRYNFESVAMEHYEVQDVWSRTIVTPPLLRLDVEISESMGLFTIENVGSAAAANVKLTFDSEPAWIHGQRPSPLRDGFARIQPGRRLRFVGFDLQSLLTKPGQATLLAGSVAYQHGATGADLADQFYVELADFRGIWAERKPENVLHGAIDRLAKAVDAAVKRLPKRSLME